MATIYLPPGSLRPLVPVLVDEIAMEGELFLMMGQKLGDSGRGRRIKALIEDARKQMRRRAQAASG